MDGLVKITQEILENKIYIIRGVKVMIDFDLSNLYKVSISQLNQATKRNIKRFPDDFMFQLTKAEFDSLRSQFVISKLGRGGRRYLPFAFTELGVGMLSSVLKSQKAIQVNIFIIRAFVKLREMLSSHKDLACKLEKIDLEQKKQGKEIAIVYSLFKKITDEPIREKNKIGFNLNNENE